MNNNQSGISIILVMVVLTGVLALGLVAANLVLRESSSVRSIEQSDVAYYAAEAGAERKVYDYNKKFPNRVAATEFTAECDNLVYTLDTIGEAKWKDVGLQLLRQSSPWGLSLTGSSNIMELSLDLEGVAYPQRLTITRLSPGDFTIVVLTTSKTTGSESQSSQTGSGTLCAPGPTCTDDFNFSSNYYRVKVDETGGGSNYFISSVGTPDIVSGMIVTACGEYRSAAFERQVQITHQKWTIY